MPLSYRITFIRHVQYKTFMENTLRPTPLPYKLLASAYCVSHQHNKLNTNLRGSEINSEMHVWVSARKTLCDYVIICKVLRDKISNRHRKQDRSSLYTQKIIQHYVQCESKNPLLDIILTLFPKRLGIFSPNFTLSLLLPICARLQIFIQLTSTLMKLCHIKRDHPVHIMCAKRPPWVETHAGIF